MAGINHRCALILALTTSWSLTAPTQTVEQSATQTVDMKAGQFLQLNDEQEERFIQGVAYEDAGFYERQTSAKIRERFSLPLKGGNFSRGVDDVKGIVQQQASAHGEANVSVKFIIGRYIVKNFGKP